MLSPGLRASLDARPRCPLATLPTPLQRGPDLPGGARLWVKRDDLTGLGLGGNKARKLERLCGEALDQGADVLLTVGAGQSNHCRQTAAAGAVLGLPVELVLTGPEPAEPAGNQILSALFGARTTYTGTEDIETSAAVVGDVLARLQGEGREVAIFPPGGSTAAGASAFAEAWLELADQCAALGLSPAAVVHASSTGGTHAGLMAGRAAARAGGAEVPALIAVGVAKVFGDLGVQTADLAAATLAHLGLDGDVALEPGDLVIDWDFEGPGYAVPTAEADAAIRWAAQRAGLVLDRVYTGKAFAGLLAHAADGRWGRGDDVVFWHTGGAPALFAPGGVPA